MTNRRRAIRDVLALAEELRKRRPVMSVTVDEYEGTSHVRGGYWASTPQRAIYCYTLENARVVRRILAKYEGWDGSNRTLNSYCTLARAEGELSQAIADPKSYGRDRSAERMRKARAKLPAGACKMCLASKDSEKHLWQCKPRNEEKVARWREDRKAAS